MNRAERRRQERENRKRTATIGVLYGGPSPAILPLIHQFVGEHQGHTFHVEEDLQAVLTLRCVDCEYKDEIGEGKAKVGSRSFV